MLGHRTRGNPLISRAIWLLLFLMPALCSAHMLGLFGGGASCGCPMVPPPPMPMPCPPMLPPIPCPPPMPPCPPCPPTFCPPPVICAPPPPPCPPPQPPCQTSCPSMGMGGGGYLAGPPSYAMGSNWGGGGGGGGAGYPSVNDCCCQCGSPCRYMGRHRTHGARIFAAPTSAADDDQQEEDPTCNSEKLRAVIQDNISENEPSKSKRAIQKAAEEKLFSKINVICANGDFSYVAYTDTYCQATSGNVTCYAFRPLGLETSALSSSSGA